MNAQTPSSATPETGGPVTGSVARRKAHGRKVLAWGLLISAALHLVAILLYPSLSEAPEGRVRLDGPDRASSPAQGTQIVRISEAPPEALEQPEPPVTVEPEEVAPTREAPGRGGGEAVGDGAEAEVAGRGAAERIRNSYGDLRLITPLPDELAALSPEQLARLRLAWAIEAMNDSAALASRAPDTDWTYTDDEGRKWGVSPGKIHLGGITLPFPFSFGAPDNSAAARRARDDAEIDRAAGRAEAWESQEERARAIRERIDREREEQKGDTTGTGGGSGR